MNTYMSTPGNTAKPRAIHSNIQTGQQHTDSTKLKIQSFIKSIYISEYSKKYLQRIERHIFISIIFYLKINHELFSY